LEYGASIGVESVPDSGSVFTVRFPKASQAPVPSP
jgi:signal transduction histidine kinase